MGSRRESGPGIAGEIPAAVIGGDAIEIAAQGGLTGGGFCQIGTSQIGTIEGERKGQGLIGIGGGDMAIGNGGGISGQHQGGTGNELMSPVESGEISGSSDLLATEMRDDRDSGCARWWSWNLGRSVGWDVSCDHLGGGCGDGIDFSRAIGGDLNIKLLTGSRLHQLMRTFWQIDAFAIAE